MLFNSYNDLLNYKIQQCRKEKVTAEKLFELMLYFANEASENYQELVMIENKCRKLHGINIAEDFTKEDIHAIKPFKLSKYEVIPEEIDVPGEMIKTNEYRVVFERVENSVFGPIYMEGDKAQNVHKSDNLEVKDVEECFIKTEEAKEPDVSNIQNEIKPIEEKVEEPTNSVELKDETEEKEYYVTSFEERMQNRGWNKVIFENKAANKVVEEELVKEEKVEEPIDTTPKEVEEPKEETKSPQVQLEKEEAINNTFNKLNEELEKVGIDSENKIETFAESKKEEIRQRVEEEIAKIKDSDIVTKIEEQIENGKERIGEVVAKEVIPTATQLEKQEALASLDKVVSDGVLVGEPQIAVKEDEKVEETVVKTEEKTTLAQKEEPTLAKEEALKEETKEEPYEFINSDISPLGVGHQGTTKMSSGYEFSLDDLLKK